MSEKDRAEKAFENYTNYVYNNTLKNLIHSGLTDADISRHSLWANVTAELSKNDFEAGYWIGVAEALKNVQK